MNRPENMIQNEKGSVMIVVVVILILITMIGLAVSRLSDVDVQISKNEREYVENFYAADSAWREAVQWLDVRPQAPALVNKTAFVAGTENDHVLNIRNFGDGDDGVTNEAFPSGTEDGVLGSERNRIGYWYKVAYLNEESMAGEKAPSFGKGFRKYAFIITSIANGTQRVDVTVTKILPTGE